MALLTFLPEHSEQGQQPSNRKRKLQKQKQKQKQPSSWDQIKNLLTSICSFRDVVHGNTRVVHRADNSPESSTVGQETGLVSRKAVNGSSTRSLGSSGRSKAGATHNSSSRGMQFRKLSGCYECHMIVDPSRKKKIKILVSNGAVSELGPDDSGRNIVEIIFKSSWLKKDNSISDGNELLRFHCTNLTCALGAGGSSNLCGSIPAAVYAPPSGTGSKARSAKGAHHGEQRYGPRLPHRLYGWTEGHAGVSGDCWESEARGGGCAAARRGYCGVSWWWLIRFCSRLRRDLLQSGGAVCFQSKGYSSLFRCNLQCSRVLIICGGNHQTYITRSTVIALLCSQRIAHHCAHLSTVYCT
ncbi:hypothetical protein GH714_006553 [Hevea brasiliensis]|uniref:Uncharacterized protein n=1 Tax=Hevea brasiliensis TaxID=3981 RepID=A0A6A6MCG2_HEVBR|nr:hypothetical protein GH714_006553 [Hevea brasiliensis]